MADTALTLSLLDFLCASLSAIRAEVGAEIQRYRTTMPPSLALLFTEDFGTVKVLKISPQYKQRYQAWWGKDFAWLFTILEATDKWDVFHTVNNHLLHKDMTVKPGQATPVAFYNARDEHHFLRTGKESPYIHCMKPQRGLTKFMYHCKSIKDRQ